MPLLRRLAVGRRSWTWSREADAEQGRNGTNLKPLAKVVLKKGMKLFSEK